MDKYAGNDEIYNFENSVVYISAYSDIGDREFQEDSFLICFKNDTLLVSVCDGMGGSNGGDIASRTVVELLKQHFDTTSVINTTFFTDILDELDASVYFLTDQSNRRLNAGTTIASVLVNNGKLNWFSVGDSRIYIVRNHEIVQATRDHNYKEALIDLLKNGNINAAQYESEKNKHMALTSFLGIGGVKLYDISSVPFMLEDGDMIIVTTDGLYNSIPMEIVKSMCDIDAKEMVREIAKMIDECEMANRDNTTFVILKYQVGGDSGETNQV